MWVIFEGLDKVGKGTLEHEFLKATNFKHIVIDRGPVGYMTFDEVFGRGTKLGDQEFIHLARKIMKSKDYMIVYCTTNVDVAMMRMEYHRESCPYDYVAAQKIYTRNIRRYYKPERTFELDTSDKSVEECIKLIIDRFNQLNKGV